MNNVTEFNLSERLCFRALRTMFQGVLVDNEIDQEEGEFTLTTDAEAKKWMMRMIEEDLYMTFRYSDKLCKYVPCLKSNL